MLKHDYLGGFVIQAYKEWFKTFEVAFRIKVRVFSLIPRNMSRINRWENNKKKRYISVHFSHFGELPLCPEVKWWDLEFFSGIDWAAKRECLVEIVQSLSLPGYFILAPSIPEILWFTWTFPKQNYLLFPGNPFYKSEDGVTLTH